MKKTRLFLLAIALIGVLSTCTTNPAQSTALWTLVSYSKAEIVSMRDNGNMLDLRMRFPTDTPGQVNLRYNLNFLMQPGFKYRLSFDARTYLDKIINVSLSNSAGGGEGHGFQYLEPEFTNYLVTSQLRTYDTEFICSQGQNGSAILTFSVTGRDLSEAIFLGNIKLEPVAKEAQTKPVVGVPDLSNSKNDNYLNTVCRTIADTIFFTLDRIGKYEAIRIDSPYAFQDPAGL